MAPSATPTMEPSASPTLEVRVGVGAAILWGYFALFFLFHSPTTTPANGDAKHSSNVISQPRTDQQPDNRPVGFTVASSVPEPYPCAHEQSDGPANGSAQFGTVAPGNKCSLFIMS